LALVAIPRRTATATATEAATTATVAFGHRPRFVYDNRPPHYLTAIDGFDGLIALAIRHIREPESARLAGLAVPHQLN